MAVPNSQIISSINVSTFTFSMGPFSTSRMDEGGAAKYNSTYPVLVEVEGRESRVMFIRGARLQNPSVTQAATSDGTKHTFGIPVEVAEAVCSGSIGSLGADYPYLGKFPTSFEDASEGFLWVSCNVPVKRVVKKEAVAAKEPWLFIFRTESSLSEETGEVEKVTREHNVRDVKKVFSDHPTSPSFEVLLAVELRFSSYGIASIEEDIGALELRGTVKKAWLITTAPDLFHCIKLVNKVDGAVGLASTSFI
jgi:hypothetical protein